MVTGANPSSGSELCQGHGNSCCLHQQLALLGEVAVKAIILAGITCGLETAMLILTMYLTVLI